MGRIVTGKPQIYSAGYLTSRAMLQNVSDLVKHHLSPHLAIGGPGARILDVGCGHGPYYEMLKEWRIVGVNIDRDDASPDVVGDGLCLPFKTDSLDAIICTQVIEHVRDPDLLVREIGRGLKSGGLLLLTGPMYWPLHEEPNDYWRFTKYGMKALLENNGFDLIELRDDGHAISLAVVVVNQLFRGWFFAPLRMVFNMGGLFAEKLICMRHCTANLSLVARRKHEE